MSYFCYDHNWTSPNYSCPSCLKLLVVEAPLDTRTVINKNEIDLVKQERDEYREALSFYSDKFNWGNGCAAIDPSDTWTCDLNVLRGGALAREVLKKWKK